MRLLTIPEVSDLLRVPDARAYELARQRKIPVVRIGRQVRIPEDRLLAWIESAARRSVATGRRSPKRAEPATNGSGPKPRPADRLATTKV